MHTPLVHQRTIQPHSSLMDQDTTPNGRSKGMEFQHSLFRNSEELIDDIGLRTKRPRSATNPEVSSVTGSPILDRESPTVLTRSITSPQVTPPPKVQPKSRRSIFSILASAAQPPTPPPSKPEQPIHDADAELNPQLPHHPASSPSFMANLARRFSGSSAKKPLYDLKSPVPQCARRTLNVNHSRPRCEIKELENIHLRRVSFVADETLISKRSFAASDPYETDLPRELKLKNKDLKEAYYRAARNRELIADDRVAKAFSQAKICRLEKLDLSWIKFASKDDVLPICDTLSLANGLEEVVLDHCELTDEQLRLFLAQLLCLRSKHDNIQPQLCRGIAKLSLAANKTLTLEGWKLLAYFVHMVLSWKTCIKFRMAVWWP